MDGGISPEAADPSVWAEGKGHVALRSDSAADHEGRLNVTVGVIIYIHPALPSALQTKSG
jgi:hypothetical protein